MKTSQHTFFSRLKAWLYAAAVVAFLCIWLSVMIAGSMAAVCRNDRYEGETKLRYCNISLAAASWASAFAIERAKGSIIHLERGIALSQMGREEEAIAAFKDAIFNASAHRGPWVSALHERMGEIVDPQVQENWAQAKRMSS